MASSNWLTTFSCSAVRPVLILLRDTTSADVLTRLFWPGSLRTLTSCFSFVLTSTKATPAGSSPIVPAQFQDESVGRRYLGNYTVSVAKRALHDCKFSAVATWAVSFCSRYVRVVYTACHTDVKFAARFFSNLGRFMKIGLITFEYSMMLIWYPICLSTFRYSVPFIWYMNIPPEFLSKIKFKILILISVLSDCPI